MNGVFNGKERMPLEVSHFYRKVPKPFHEYGVAR